MPCERLVQGAGGSVDGWGWGGGGGRGVNDCTIGFPVVYANLGFR